MTIGMANDAPSDTAVNQVGSPHDSARGSPVPLNSFHTLVKDINSILGPSNGIDSAGVDVDELKATMAAYTSNQEEWDMYAFADQSRAYTRNLVDRGNGKSNLVCGLACRCILLTSGATRPIELHQTSSVPLISLQLILVWSPGKASPIHDHANAHCVMKILKGSLTETIYGWPCQRSDGLTDCAASPTSVYPTTQHTCSANGEYLEPGALNATRSTLYNREQVTYMSDRLGLHRIQNSSNDEVAVSLHLYTVC